MGISVVYIRTGTVLLTWAVVMANVTNHSHMTLSSFALRSRAVAQVVVNTLVATVIRHLDINKAFMYSPHNFKIKS